jgi:hypothetical protein
MVIWPSEASVTCTGRLVNQKSQELKSDQVAARTSRSSGSASEEPNLENVGAATGSQKWNGRPWRYPGGIDMIREPY